MRVASILLISLANFFALSCKNQNHSDIQSEVCYYVKSEKYHTRQFRLCINEDGYRKEFDDGSLSAGRISDSLNIFFEQIVKDKDNSKNYDSIKNILSRYQKNLGRLKVQINQKTDSTSNYKILYSNAPHIVEDWGVISKIGINRN